MTWPYNFDPARHCGHAAAAGRCATSLSQVDLRRKVARLPASQPGAYCSKSYAKSVHGLGGSRSPPSEPELPGSVTEPLSQTSRMAEKKTCHIALWRTIPRISMDTG
jgi:hypothetical protein